MHYRFKGNPNTNDAARLLAENKRRAAKGLPPLTLAQFTNHIGASVEPVKAKPATTPQRKLF